MRISWNWLSELVDLSSLEGPQALAALLTARGLEVESVTSLGQGLKNVVTAQIVEFKPHPQADRLNLCQVITGVDVAPIEIVCGAPNVKAGAKVALAQVGAELPNGMKIVISKIRGVTSNGMLCSESELKLSESSEGIIILPESTPLGQPLAQILGRDDTVFDLKITANRADCLSHFGIAREVAAALGKKAKAPTLSKGFATDFSGSVDAPASPISVSLDAGEDSRQFFGCGIEGVKVGPSPDWLVKRLEVLGSRSINNVVDATNLVLFELGQPTHAYDASKIRGNQLHVRAARAGESLVLLDGQTIQLEGFELVIADAERPVALAGVMGGGNSEVQTHTKTLFLECAEFSPTLVRRASAKHQRKTDASHRFERGVNPSGLSFAISRLADLIIEVAGGRIVGQVVKTFPESRLKSLAVKREIRFDLHYVHDFLGFPRDADPVTLKRMEEVLRDLECEVQADSKGWLVKPPAYRLDLNSKEDIAEEVARSVGYDLIPTTVPGLTSTPVFGSSSLPRLRVMDRAKESLVKSGLRETIGFSFSNQAKLGFFGFSSNVPILNPLSEEYTHMVPSLLPGLIQNVSDNWNQTFGSEALAVRLFTLRPTFSAAGPIQASGQMDTGVSESWKLSLVMTGPRFAGGLRCDQSEVDFYDLKSVVDQLLTALGTRGARYLPLSASRSKGGIYQHLFHPGKSVELMIGSSVAGYFGLLHPAKSRDLKTRTPLWIAELDWELVSKLSRKASDLPTFKTWSQFPSIERDFALVVQNEVTAERLCQVALKAGKPLVKEAKVFDIYRGAQVAEGMTSVAVRVIFYDEQRSLQEVEAEQASARILESWKKELHAELRG